MESPDPIMCHTTQGQCSTKQSSPLATFGNGGWVGKDAYILCPGTPGQRSFFKK